MPTYKDAGVDLDKADRLVDRLATHQERTEEETSRDLYRGVGGFAAGFDLGEYENPVVFSTCDGVGTKFLLQKKYDALEAAGRDLVAMNVNDLLTSGVDPLLFLDYVAMSPLDEQTIESLVQGMAEACVESNCLLAGGETAELPGMIEEGDVELAGFCVGAAEKDRLRDSSEVEEDQVILGLPSNGFHANGFSLVRSVLDQNPTEFSDEDVQSLLTPTRLYGDAVRQLREKQVTPSAMVHVTGGGLEGNLSRVLPEGLGATLEIPEWDRPVVRDVLEHVPLEEAFRTFNMGFGWLLIVRAGDVEVSSGCLEDVTRLGNVTGDGTISIRYRGETV